MPTDTLDASASSTAPRWSVGVVGVEDTWITVRAATKADALAAYAQDQRCAWAAIRDTPEPTPETCEFCGEEGHCTGDCGVCPDELDAFEIEDEETHPFRNEHAGEG